MGANTSSPRFNDRHLNAAKSGDLTNSVVTNIITDNEEGISNSSNSKQHKSNKGRHRGRRQQAIANAAAGLLSRFRKTVLHQLLLRKSRSSTLQLHHIIQSPRRSRGDVGEQQQQQQTVAIISRPSSRPGSTSRSIRSSIVGIAPVANFDDIEDSSGHHSSRHSRNNKQQQQHQRIGKQGAIITQPQQKQQQLPTTTTATMTHVRIRISCSDSLGDALRRCDVSTQTETTSFVDKTKRPSLGGSGGTTRNTNQHPLSSGHHHHSSHHHSNKENRHNHGEDAIVGSYMTKSISSGISDRQPSSWMGSECSSASNSSSGVDVNSPDDGHPAFSSVIASSVSSATNSTSSMSKQKQQQQQTSDSNCEPKGVITRRTTIQASTGELLECLGQFVKTRFSHIAGVSNTTVVSWMRAIDRSLISQGWQDTPFISPGTVVFVYMLLRDSSMPHPSARLNNSNSFPSSNPSVSMHYKTADVMQFDATLKPTLFDLRCHVNACLYIAYSYAGIEISYPQRPFNVVERPPPSTPPTSTVDFWQRTLDVTLALSEKMLRLNSDPLYFARTFAELKAQGSVTVATNTTAVGTTTPALGSHHHHRPDNRTTSPAPPVQTSETNHQGRNSSCSFKSSVQPSAPGAVRGYAGHNTSCRSSVINSGMTARERAGEHYSSLLI